MAAKKVFIGIPNKGNVKFDTMAFLLSTLSGATYDSVLCGQSGTALDFQRNYICYLAMQHAADYVCFVDTDMKSPADTINKLMALGKPVVGVASRKKKVPFEYTIEVDEPKGARVITNDELPKEPFCRINDYPILVGTGIMLLDLKVVNDWIPKPWFRMETTWDDGEEPGYTGEDIYFCRKAWAWGLEVWCDPTIPVKHIGDFEY